MDGAREADGIGTDAGGIAGDSLGCKDSLKMIGISSATAVGETDTPGKISVVENEAASPRTVVAADEIREPVGVVRACKTPDCEDNPLERDDEVMGCVDITEDKICESAPLLEGLSATEGVPSSLMVLLTPDCAIAEVVSLG